MRALAGWALMAVLFASVAWTKQGVAAGPAAASGMAELERNLSLGAEIADQQGAEAQFAEIRKLADEGLKSARAAVQRDPKSAEAQYLLGSWVLYGYHVVKADRITYDAQGVEHQDKVSRVVQGDQESATEGLEALKKACDLAPQRGRYLVDYGAALYDYERPALATAALKKIWIGDVQVTAADRMRAAELMCDIDTEEGDIAGARGWLYRALAENRDNAGIVQRLRQLDVLQAEAAAAEAEAQGAAAEEPAASEESGGEVAPGTEEAPAAGGDEQQPTPGEDQSGMSDEGGAGQAEPGADQSEAAPAEPGADQWEAAPAEPGADQSEAAPAE